MRSELSSDMAAASVLEILLKVITERQLIDNASVSDSIYVRSVSVAFDVT